jgi:hypothetical protein
VAAERAPAGLKQPSESHLHEISGIRAPEIYGFAVWAACGEDLYSGADHGRTCALAAPPSRPLSCVSSLLFMRVLCPTGANAYFSTSSTTPQIMASVVSMREAMEAAF